MAILSRLGLPAFISSMAPFQRETTGSVRLAYSPVVGWLERSDSSWGNTGAFAAISRDGEVIVWGDPARGGQLDEATAALLTRQTDRPWIWTVELAASSGAFAARRANGQVVTWGSDWPGGGVIPADLEPALSDGVVRVFGLLQGFAAVKSDGRVITWGPGPGHSDQPSALDPSRPYQVVTSSGSLAILQGDQLVGCWGGIDGAFQWNQHDELRHALSSGVVELVSHEAGFAARTVTGLVVTWGVPDVCGDTSGVSITSHPDIVKLGSDAIGFHGFDGRGRIRLWNSQGGSFQPGNSVLEQPGVKGVPITGAVSFSHTPMGGIGWLDDQDVYQLYQYQPSVRNVAFLPMIDSGSGPFLGARGLALFDQDGSLITRGYRLDQADAPDAGSPNSSGFFSPSSKPDHAAWQQVHISGGGAFAALADNGHVGLWGDPSHGAIPANPALTQSLLKEKPPASLYSNSGAFVALAADGTAISWGRADSGGDRNGAPQIFTGLDHLVSPWANARIDEQGVARQYRLTANNQPNPDNQAVPVLVQEGDQLTAEILDDPNGDRFDSRGRLDTTGHVYLWQRDGQVSGADDQASIRLDAFSTGTWSLTPTYLDRPGFSRTLAPLSVQVQMVDNGQASVEISPYSFVGPADQAFSAGGGRQAELVARLAGDPEGVQTIEAVQWFRDGVPIDSLGSAQQSIVLAGEPGRYSVEATYTDGQGYRSTVRSGAVPIDPAGGVPGQSHLAVGGLQTLWQLAEDGRSVTRFDSSSLRMRPVEMAGAPGYLAISAASDGSAWALDNQGYACVYNAASNRFIRQDGSDADEGPQLNLGRGWRQIVAARGSQGAPALWLLDDTPLSGGSNVAFVPGALAAEQTVADLRPIRVNDGPSLRLLAVGDDQTPWGIDMEGNLWSWDGSSQGFRQLATGVGSHIRQLQMVDQGQVWGLDEQGVLQMWNSEAQHFTPVPLDSPFWSRRNGLLASVETPTWESFSLSRLGGFTGIPRSGVTLPADGTGLVTFDTSEIRMLRDPSENPSQLQLISGETLQDNGVRQVGQNLAFNLNRQVNVAYMLNGSGAGQWEGAAVVPNAQSGADLRLEPGPNRDARGSRLPVLKLSWLSGLDGADNQPYGSRGYASPFGGLVFEAAAPLPPAGARLAAQNPPSGLVLGSSTTNPDRALPATETGASDPEDLGYTTAVPIEWNGEFARAWPNIDGKEIARTDSGWTKWTDLSRLFQSGFTPKWKSKKILRGRVGGYSQPGKHNEVQARLEFRYELSRDYGDDPENRPGAWFTREKPDFNRYDDRGNKLNEGEKGYLNRKKDNYGDGGGIVLSDPLRQQYGFYVYVQADSRWSIGDWDPQKTSLAIGTEVRFIIPVRSWFSGKAQFSMTLGGTVDAYGLYQRRQQPTLAGESDVQANAGAPFASFIRFVDSRDQTPATSQTPQQYLQALVDPEQLPGSDALSSFEQATPAVDFLTDVVAPVARTVLSIVLPGGATTATPELSSASTAEALLLAISEDTQEQSGAQTPILAPSISTLTSANSGAVSAEPATIERGFKAGARIRPYIGALLKVQDWWIDASLHIRAIPYLTLLYDSFKGGFEAIVEKTVVRADLELAAWKVFTARARFNIEIPGANTNKATRLYAASVRSFLDDEPQSWLESAPIISRNLNAHTPGDSQPISGLSAQLVRADGSAIGIATRLLPGNTGLFELVRVSGALEADGLSIRWDSESAEPIEGSQGLTTNVSLTELSDGRLAVAGSHIAATDPLLEPIIQLPPGAIYQISADSQAAGTSIVLDDQTSQLVLPAERIWAQLGSSLARAEALRSDWSGDSLIAGASGGNHGAGALYILNGRALSGLGDLSGLESNTRPDQGLVITGSHTSGSLSGLGTLVLNGGDTNNDGSSEIFASAPHDLNGAGLVYMLYGGRALELLPQIAPGSITLDTLDALQANPSFRNQFLQSFSGVSGSGAYGTILAGGVDLNGDNHADPLIGYAATETSTGAVELWNSRQTLQQLPFGGQSGLGLGQQAIPRFDRSVLVSARSSQPSQSDFPIASATAVGDLDADGLGDIVLSSDSRAALMFGDRLMPVYWEASSVLGSLAAAGDPDASSSLSQTWTASWVDDAGQRHVLSFAGADRNDDGLISADFGPPTGVTPEIDWLALRSDGDDPTAARVALSPEIAHHWSGALQIHSASIRFDPARTTFTAPVTISAAEGNGENPFIWSSGDAGLTPDQSARSLRARLLASNAPGVLQAAGIGDFNGDGLSDLALSQAGVRVPNRDGTALERRPGQTAVVYGSSALSMGSSPLLMEQVGTVGGAIGGLLLGDRGGELSAIGDWNRDGMDDLLIREPSAPGAGGSEQAGSHVVLHGRADSTASLDLEGERQAGRAQILLGSVASSLSGASATAGDFAANGRPSLLIGAPNTIREEDLRRAAAGMRVLTATQNADGSWQTPQQLPPFEGAATGQQQLSSYSAVGNRVLATWVHNRSSASGGSTDELWAAFQDPDSGQWGPAHRLQSSRRGDPASPAVGEVQALALTDANQQMTGGVLLVWTTLDPSTGRAFLFQSSYDPTAGGLWSTAAQQDPEALLLANQDAISGSQLRLQLSPNDPEDRSQLWAEASVSHEGQRAATIHLRRSGDLSEPLTLSFSTRDRSASAGSQYEHSSGSVSFAAGEHSATVLIPLIDNTLLEHRKTEFVVDFRLPDQQAAHAQLLLGNTLIAAASGQAVMSVGATIKDNDVIQMRAIDAGISLEGPPTGTTGATATASTAVSVYSPTGPARRNHLQPKAPGRGDKPTEPVDLTPENDPRLTHTVGIVGDPGANEGLGQAYALLAAATTQSSAANPGMDWKELGDINWLDQPMDADQGDRRQLNVLIQPEPALAALDPRAGFGTAMVKLWVNNETRFAISAPGNPLDGTRPGHIYVVRAKTIQDWALKSNADRLKALILSDTNTLVIEENSGGLFGSVLAAADLNGDGSDELIVGAPGAQTVTVIDGTAIPATGRRTSSSLSDRVITDDSRESTGFGSAITALDLNADGALDLAIGAPSANPVDSGVNFEGSTESVGNAGAVHVVWGEQSANAESPTTLNPFRGAVVALSNMTTLQGFGTTNPRGSEEDPPRPASEGLPPPGSFGFGEELGSALAAVDLNGDGHKDLAIGAPHYTPDGSRRTGRVVTLFAEGSRPWQASIDLSHRIDPGKGVSFIGQQGGGHLGASLAAAGDLQGDGNDDLAIGAPFEDGGAGRVYVAFGSRNRYGQSALEVTGNSFRVDATDPDSPFQTFEAPVGYRLGRSMVGLGDLNNDSSTGIGGMDLFLGSPDGTDPREIRLTNGDIQLAPAGQTHLAWGRPWLGPNQSLEVPFTQGVGYLLPFGGVPLALGDLNGDGYDDYALLGNSDDRGSATPSEDATKLRIRFGAAVEYEQQQLLLTNFDLKPAGTPLAPDRVPLVVAGDFDGDAFGDVIACTQGEESLKLLRGAPNLSVQGDAKTHWNTSGQSINVSAVSDPISQLASGDFDGDGYDDLVVINQSPILSRANPTLSMFWGSPTGLQAGGQKQLTSGKTTGRNPGIDGVIALDSNGDGVDELALYGSDLSPFWISDSAAGWGLQVLALNRTSTDPFRRAVQSLAIATGVDGVPTALSQGDLNGDGFADLLIDHGGNTIDLVIGDPHNYLKPANLAFSIAQRPTDQTAPAGLQRSQLARFIGDVNADGRDDLLFSPTSPSPRTPNSSNPELAGSWKRGPYSYVYLGSGTNVTPAIPESIQIPRYWDESEDNQTTRPSEPRYKSWEEHGFAIESLPGEPEPYRVGGIGDVNGDGFNELMFSSNKLYVGEKKDPEPLRPHSIAIYGSTRTTSEALRTTTSNDGSSFNDTLHQLGSAGKQELLLRGKAGSDLLQVHADPYGATLSIPSSGDHAGRLTVSASNDTTLWSQPRNAYELVLKDGKLQIIRTKDEKPIKTWGDGGIDRVYLSDKGWLYLLKSNNSKSAIDNRDNAYLELNDYRDYGRLLPGAGVAGLAGWFANAGWASAREAPTTVSQSQLVFSPETGALYLVNRQSQNKNPDTGVNCWAYNGLEGHITGFNTSHNPVSYLDNGSTYVRSAHITLFEGDSEAKPALGAPTLTQVLNPRESLLSQTGAALLEQPAIETMDALQTSRKDLETFVGSAQNQAIPFGVRRRLTDEHDRSLAEVLGGTPLQNARDDLAWAASAVQQAGPYVVVMDGNGRLTINAQNKVDAQIKPGSELAVLHEGNPDPFLPPVGSTPLLLRPETATDQVSQAASRSTNNSFTAVLKGGLDDDRLGIDSPQRFINPSNGGPAGAVDGGPGIDTLFFSSQRSDGTGATINLTQVGSRIRNIEAIEIPINNTLEIDEAPLLNTPLHRLKLESRGAATVNFHVREPYRHIGDQMDAGLAYSVYAKPNSNLQVWVQQGRVTLQQPFLPAGSNTTLNAVLLNDQPSLTTTALPLDATGLGADPDPVYRWYRNNRLLTNETTASFSPAGRASLTPGRYHRETDYTRRNGLRETVSSPTLRIEPRLESSQGALQIVRSRFSPEQRRTLLNRHTQFKLHNEWIGLEFIGSAAGPTPAFHRVPLALDRQHDREAGLLAFVNAEGGNPQDLQAYDFNGDSAIDSITWTPSRSSPGASVATQAAVISAVRADLTLQDNGVIGFADVNAGSALRLGARQSLRLSLLQPAEGSPATPVLGAILAVPLEQEQSLADLTADQRRARAIRIFDPHAREGIPHRFHAQRELAISTESRWALLELQNTRPETWDGSLAPDVASPLEPLVPGEAQGARLRLISASGQRLQLDASSSPQSLDSFVARSQVQAPLLDFRGLPDQPLDATVSIVRPAGLPTTFGFYAVDAPDGRIIDPISGRPVRPGNPGYAALATANRVDGLNAFAPTGRSMHTTGLSFQESRLLAPFAMLPDAAGLTRTYYAFPRANPDGTAHFSSFGTNVIGFDQAEDGRVADFRDTVVAIRLQPLPAV